MVLHLINPQQQLADLDVLSWQEHLGLTVGVVARDTKQVIIMPFANNLSL